MLRANCQAGLDYTWVQRVNTTVAAVDVWTNAGADGLTRAGVWSATSTVTAAYWGVADNRQRGDTLVLGQGNSPGARKTSTVTLSVYRSAIGAPCGVQAMATSWSTP